MRMANVMTAVFRLALVDMSDGGPVARGDFRARGTRRVIQTTPAPEAGA